MALREHTDLIIPSEVATRPRLALASIVPVFDLVLLSAVIAITGHLDRAGLAYGVLTFFALRGAGTQAPRINPRLGDEIPTLAAAVLAPLAIVSPWAGDADRIVAILSIGVVVAPAIIVGRGIVYALVRAARARGLVIENTVIVGAGLVGRQVARTLQSHPEYGLAPVGFVESVHEENLEVPVVGSTDQLEHVIREFDIQRVIVAFGITREPEMVDIIRACDGMPVEVHLVPRFFELGMSAEGRSRDDLWGIPIVRLRRSALRTAAWRTKRAFDLLVGSLAFLLTFPIFALAALGVRLSGAGPIFFRQVRIGQHGRLFELLKFRTLRPNGDSDTTWSVDGGDDHRVTLAGRILRRSSIDELPQLINVLRGQMSLIGPRPERPFFVDRFSHEFDRYEDRHRVPVGITGWAQAHGLRGDTSIPERVRFDNFYIEHWSLWRDVVITVRTVWLILTGRH